MEENSPEMKNLNLYIEIVYCVPEKVGPDQSTQRHILVE